MAMTSSRHWRNALGGFYSPSPGGGFGAFGPRFGGPRGGSFRFGRMLRDGEPRLVYPTLTFLDEAGHVTGSADGNKKVYTIAESGTAYLDEHREAVNVLFEQMEAFGQKMDRAREWFGWAEGGSDEQPSKPESEVMKELEQARRRLRALIVAVTEGTDSDQQRVAEILQRAADEILGKPAAK